MLLWLRGVLEVVQHVAVKDVEQEGSTQGKVAHVKRVKDEVAHIKRTEEEVAHINNAKDEGAHVNCAEDVVARGNGQLRQLPQNVMIKNAGILLYSM